VENPLVIANPAASIAARTVSLAALAPDRLAVTDGTVRLCYRELEEQSNRLATHLQEAGAGPERCIGLFFERSAPFVVAALAVLKTGAAYLPLDSFGPLQRAGLILGNANATLLLTHRGKARDLEAGPWRVIEIDGPDKGSIASRPAAPVQVNPAPGSLAYIIYTSGSTGQPKGVEITHANLTNLIEWHQSEFQVTAADRASVVAGLGFDAAVWEIWPHLTAGASLHIADEHTRRSPQALRDWLVAEGITISFVPTVLAEQLLRVDWPPETALRILLTGADTLRRRPGIGLPFTLVNNYGPTECSVVATSGRVLPGAETDGPPPIGRPIANATALILDDALRPMPPGEVGELCLAGALVGRGYRNDLELTASRFVACSPASGTVLRVYRTGDRARFLPNGEIAFLGRLDEQVKIRGYRIELGEIAAWLDRCPGVAACAVVARDPEQGGDGAFADGPLLVAYVVPARDAQLTATGLREFLAQRLPDYMIPARFVAIAALPTTTNGKLNKSALPAPAANNLLSDQVSERTPSEAAGSLSSDNDLVQQVATLVASLVGQTSVDTEANFFMIGGHSMLGAQLVAQISERFGVKLTLRQLFSAPTVAALSAEVERRTSRS
jgi:amino acid adenylation domain-containing protein